jgi:hypothetical protein
LHTRREIARRNRAIPKSNIPKHSKSISDEIARDTRRGLVKLKKRGLYKGKVVGRKLTLADAKRVRSFEGVLTGRDKLVSVRAKDRKNIRETGTRVVRGKAIVEPGRKIRKGRVYQETSPGVYTELHRMKRGVSLDAAVKDAFAELPHPNGIAFTLYGNRSYRVYYSSEALLFDLTAYNLPVEKTLVSHMTFFDPGIPASVYQGTRQIERQETLNRQADRFKAYRKTYAKRRAARRRGKA